MDVGASAANHLVGSEADRIMRVRPLLGVEAMSQYAGRVYDGPLEGQYRIENRPRFSVMRAFPDLVVCLRPGAIVHLKTTAIEYRWSAPLRAWVWLSF